MVDTVRSDLKAIERRGNTKAAEELATIHDLAEAHRQYPGRGQRIDSQICLHLQRAEIREGRVLEIGPRNQSRRNLFPEQYFDFETMDIDPDIATIQGDITDCPQIPDTSFDVVLSVDVFEHLTKPWNAANEISRILKPGGLSYTTTVFSWRYHPCPIDYWRFTPACLRFLFGELTEVDSGFDGTERRRDFRKKSARDPFRFDALGGWRENVRVFHVGVRPKELKLRTMDPVVGKTTSSEPTPQRVIDVVRCVWEDHEDERYRQINSHWRGVGRWDNEAWEELGQQTLERIDELYRLAPDSSESRGGPALLEWGPGGGANLFALAGRARVMYGVDVSAKNLREAQAVLAEKPEANFRPILLDRDPEAVLSEVDEPIDLFISTAVFQHFPSKQYGIDVLRVMSSLMREGALAYVQIRFDNGEAKYASKPIADYFKDHLTATSYELSEFWDHLVQTGFTPLRIGEVRSDNNYASFYFRRN